MSFIRAWQVFCRALWGQGDCPHSRVSLHDAPTYCQDCNYPVRVAWTLLQCRRCEHKRAVKKSWMGGFQPVQAYCRHCGSEDYRLSKKRFIEAWELPFAHATLVTCFEEELGKDPSILKPFRASITAESGDSFEVDYGRKAYGQKPQPSFIRRDLSWAWDKSPHGPSHTLI